MRLDDIEKETHKAFFLVSGTGMLWLFLVKHN